MFPWKTKTAGGSYFHLLNLWQQIWTSIGFRSRCRLVLTFVVTAWICSIFLFIRHVEKWRFLFVSSSHWPKYLPSSLIGLQWKSSRTDWMFAGRPSSTWMTLYNRLPFYMIRAWHSMAQCHMCSYYQYILTLNWRSKIWKWVHLSDFETHMKSVALLWITVYKCWTAKLLRRLTNCCDLDVTAGFVCWMFCLWRKLGIK